MRWGLRDVPQPSAGCGRRGSGASARTSGARSSRAESPLLAALRACALPPPPTRPPMRREPLGLARHWIAGHLLVLGVCALPAVAHAQGRLDLTQIPDLSRYEAVWPLRYDAPNPAVIGSFGLGFTGVRGDGGERRL